MVTVLGQLADAARLEAFVNDIVVRTYDGSENEAPAANPPTTVSVKCTTHIWPEVISIVSAFGFQRTGRPARRATLASWAVRAA
jgi:hypothetical protein